MLDKTYDPAPVEPRIYGAWEKAGVFKAGAGAKPGAKPYSIVIPPPNVTGSLHMGHALNNTLQDILVRFERMRGRDVLWQPGTDHAGIATQMVVERQMMERQEPNRRVIGREKFLEKVWAWKAESGGTIINQLKRLGCSCDWSRERFTMDEGLSRAVTKVFVDLHRAGLIYKDKRLVNWDPKLETAISDLEVVQTEVRGSLWHLRYPIEGATFDPADPTTYIVVATTRPETMLGDTAVAVHPDSPKWQHFIGKNAILPLVGRRIPILADDYADPEKGSGAVKITPAHDFNDFEVGKRRGLRQITVLNSVAEISIERNQEFWEGTPFADQFGSAHDLISSIGGFPEGEYVRYAVDDPKLDQLRELGGLDRFVARKRIVAVLEELGLVEKIEPHTHTVPHGDRSGVPVEPRLADQWYVDAKTLAQPAIAAVREGRTKFVPKNWEKTYFEWMENIQPWCVSRQIWWGHQVPIWYGPNGDVFCEKSEADMRRVAEAKYRKEIRIVPRADFFTWTLANTVLGTGEVLLNDPEVLVYRDEDVLDTWFSSALWPFSTLGWPDSTDALKRYYPTSVLVTGFDIIFFWVARMMMMGLHFMKDAKGTPVEPFADVYIHALVRDEKGAKMSKSKGNVIDPLGLIDEYGADALRFTLAAMAAQGRDIKLATSRVAGYRNFATKLWNAARFGEMNQCALDPAFVPAKAKETLNRWILTELTRTARDVTAALEAYRFNDAAGALYRFIWNLYCDSFVEHAKPVLSGPDGPAKDETRATAAYVLTETLKVLHPFMPFITEELWQHFRGASDGAILPLVAWPEAGIEDAAAAAEINWVVDAIGEIRSVLTELGVPGGAMVPLAVVSGASAETLARLERHDAVIKRRARIAEIGVATAPIAGAIQIALGEATLSLSIADIVDVAAEKARLAKEIDAHDKEIGKIDAKLGKADFLARAPEEVVEEQRERRADALALRERAAAALSRLSA